MQFSFLILIVFYESNSKDEFVSLVSLHYIL
jgi:hypothetical protein